PDRPHSTPENSQRKVFQCIVDETALIGGVKKSTRDGIRKWVSQGAIRLYVPLHTLKQLERLKQGNDRSSADAREAIKWLDDITSLPAVVASGSVQLEGVDEQFVSWEEVEPFLLPETLLSLENSGSEITYEDDLEESFTHLDISDETSMSSSHSLEDPPKTPQSTTSMFSNEDTKKEVENHFHPNSAALMVGSPDRTARNSVEIPGDDRMRGSKYVVPDYLKSLFNHILWRIHREKNPDAALESFILLTNDDAKQSIAHKFGIRVKRLEQMRDAIVHEDRECRNRMAYLKMDPRRSRPTNIDANVPSARPKSGPSDVEDDSDEDEVLFKRAPRGPQAPQAQQPRAPESLDSSGFNQSSQQPAGRGRGRNARGGNTSRGRGSFPRGRGNAAARGTYAPPAVQMRTAAAARTIDPNQPIDPNSFSRPNIRGASVRGNTRKLWEPN
ncbi:hypothetical protein BU24DRAFT_332039, partial [Aaosphaeria arxii CBS 175.79]